MDGDKLAFARGQMNRLAKWRSVFAGWQLGTRADTDPESQAVRDHREATLLLRAEMTAVVGLMVEAGVCTLDEFTVRWGQEAELLSLALEDRFPGFKATDYGMNIDITKAAQDDEGVATVTRMPDGRGPKLTPAPKSFDKFLAEAQRIVHRDAALPPLQRKPVAWCSYRGDVTEGLPNVAGPNLFGEPLFPVEASYDVETDRTRVGWSFIAPGEQR